MLLQFIEVCRHSSLNVPQQRFSRVMVWPLTGSLQHIATSAFKEVVTLTNNQLISAVDKQHLATISLLTPLVEFRVYFAFHSNLRLYSHNFKTYKVQVIFFNNVLIHKTLELKEGVLYFSRE